MYTPSAWEKIKYEKGTQVIPSDTAFLMVSNRHFDQGQIQFADEETDTTQRHILYVCKRKDSFFVHEIKSIAEGIAKFSKKNWVLYTEGMGKTFDGNIERAYLMTKTYDVNVILFDYASINNQMGVIKNFKFSLRNSNNSSRQYALFLKEIETIQATSDLFKGSELSIFLHSMGNLMFRKMMLDHGFEKAETEPFIQNIIFNASCVNRKNHHRWISKIDFAKQIFVNYNKADYKLNGAMLLSGNRKLGSKPKFPFAKKIQYIDFHDAVGKTHNYFLNIPTRTFVMSARIQNYFTQILNGRDLYPPDMEKSSNVGYKMKK
jgi:hypothetical protein